MASQPGRGRYLWLVAAVMAATICKVSLATLTYGTNDAATWESAAKLIDDGKQDLIYGGRVVVRDPHGEPFDVQVFNHPPFMVYVLSGLNWVNHAFGLPIRVTLRLLDSIADIGSMFLTVAIMRNIAGTIPLVSMILLALSPAWIFISGFHANTDPLMLFFLLLTVYLIEVRGRSGLGGASFAVATGIKMVPFLLLPALLLYFQTWKDRLRTVLILGVFWVVISLEWLRRTPRDMLRNVAGYASSSGHWGIGWILSNIPVSHYLLERAFNRYGRYALIPVLLAMAVWLNRRRRVILFHQFGILLFEMLTLTPGFGIQYLVWLIPWAATLPWLAVATVVATSGLFCGAIYTWWSGGLPWYYADSVSAGDWRGAFSLLAFAVWLNIALVLPWMPRVSLSEASERSRHAVPTPHRSE